jgi:hypothetical protein
MAPAYGNLQPLSTYPEAPGASTAMNGYGEPMGASTNGACGVVCAPSPFESRELPGYTSVAAARIEQPQPAEGYFESQAPVVTPVVAQRYYPERRYYHSSYYRPRHRVVVVRRRPFRRSAMIVAGSAAGGAAIGAIAGGGKGAGIGAIAGGASGLVYDRLTHKKRVVVTR